jgi:hypothetical protein
MPTVTFDGRSFMLDGRRIWIVSGSMHYARVSSDQWSERLHAMRVAGLNTVETPVVWSRHNPRPGVLDFSGDNDLRRFVQMVGSAGMHCILRMGPFVGGDWDLGGIPAWVLRLPEVRLRTGSGPYLDACSRFITAVAEQIRDLQVTSAGKGGPVLLIQNEHAWTCGHAEAARLALGELVRYYREAGLTVPIINANNLWQSVEGEIDCWTGSTDPLSMMRQLGTVRPDQPRLIIDFPVAESRYLGAEEPASLHPMAVQRRIAEALAGGAQVNLSPFVAGSVPGFWGGKSPADRFLPASSDGPPDAPINAMGRETRWYGPIRRVCTFASRFARVLSHLDPAYAPVGIDPAHPLAPGVKGRGRGRGLSRGEPPRTSSCVVAHVSGSQGGVAFVFGDDPGTGEPTPGQSATLLMPDGSTLPVHLGGQSVAWVIMEVNLGGRARINYCNLNALAAVGRVLVCYGPAGTPGIVSINGSPIEFVVPTGSRPFVTEHENITLVACNESSVDQTFVTDAGVYVGVAGLTAEMKPIGLPGSRTCLFVNSEGQSSSVPVEASRPSEPAAPGRGSLSTWMYADQHEYMLGQSPRYAAIDGPADLAALGCPHGYGWYRVSMKSGPGGRVHVLAPEGGDRLHLFVDGEPAAILGVGPGAEPESVLQLRKSAHELVILAENAGRFAGGMHMHERKGLPGHLWSVNPLKGGVPRAVTAASLDVLSFMVPVWEVREGDATLPERPTWVIQHRKKGALVATFVDVPVRALVVLNDVPLAYVDRAGPTHVVLPEEKLTRGNNTIQLAVIPDPAGGDPDMATLLERLTDGVRFAEMEEELTAKGQWAFAKWEAPAASAFRPASGRTLARRHEPTWWKSHFRPADTRTPLLLSLQGMTKGQVYVNGRHVARYFQATADGRGVAPAPPLHVPAYCLKPGEENELLIFDEHGGHPNRIELTYASEPVGARGKGRS